MSVSIKTPLKSSGLALLLLLAAALSALPVVDQEAERKYEDMFQRALMTFALARTLNGVISVVQGTELALQPAGVGLTLTPGEILDPVNDLVERFSWVMLGATVSLGVQQVLLDISGSWLVRAMAALSCLLALVIMSRRKGEYLLPPVLVRLLIVLLFMRLAVPVTLLMNEMVYQGFLDVRYRESTEAISAAGVKLEEVGAQDDAPMPEGGAESSILFGSIERAVDSATQALNLHARVAEMREQAGHIIQHLIQMSVVFVFQTALLPILFLWLLLQAVRRVVRRERV
ncbi:MAG: hypothetical protein HKN69_14930 [Desulfofustis sp.]|nr:hypothetical protein [Desulfofustis sp.]